MERFKATFTFNDLKDEYCRYYLSILDRLDNETDKGSDYSVIIDTILIYNRSFLRLLAAADTYTAFAVVRLQLDNLIYLYANFKYPEKRVLKAVFSGRDLNQIKVGGNALKHPELRKQLDEEYSTTIKKYFGDTTIDELFRKYCGYIHPSKLQADIPNDFYVDNKGNTLYLVSQQRKYAKDMIAINNLIGKLLKDILKDDKNQI